MPAMTAREPGNGTGTLVYTLASDSFDVESVYVSIDNTAGASAVTAELTIKDQSGVVIARKKQSGTIAAGATGSATWALRLDDEGAAGATTNAVLYDTTPQTATFLESTTSAGTSIADKGNVSGSGLYLYSSDGAGAAGFVSIETADGQVFIGSSRVVIRQAPSGLGVIIQNHLSVPIFTIFDDGSVLSRLAIGATFEIDDHNGNPLLRVDEAGSFHILTGQVWQADL